MAWGAGAAVVFSAAEAVLINELPQGWPWWVAVGAVVALAAALAAWMAGGSAGRRSGDVLGAGAVKAANIEGAVQTYVGPGVGVVPEVTVPPGGDWLGAGAVKADGDICGSVTTTVLGSPDQVSQ